MPSRRAHNRKGCGLYKQHRSYTRLTNKELWRRRRFGTDPIVRWEQEDLPTTYEEGQDYTKADLGSIADAMLREDSKREMCRECGEYGDPTGQQKPETFDDIKDGSGNPLAVLFNEYRCPDGHSWYQGEGSLRGIGGDNPILFEEHFQARKRREIYTTLGTPDPSIVQGLYNRTHPQGRKVNSLEQRKKNGASWYR